MSEQLLNKIFEKLVEMDSEIKTIKTEVLEVKASQVRMENEHGQQLTALFDAREVQFDVNERICDTLNRIEGKMDRLSLKVSSHDSRLKHVK